jgi:hypothetical protein
MATIGHSRHGEVKWKKVVDDSIEFVLPQKVGVARWGGQGSVFQESSYRLSSLSSSVLRPFGWSCVRCTKPERTPLRTRGITFERLHFRQRSFNFAFVKLSLDDQSLPPSRRICEVSLGPFPLRKVVFLCPVMSFVEVEPAPQKGVIDHFRESSGCITIVRGSSGTPDIQETGVWMFHWRC